MTRDELLAKKRELLAQIEAFKRKADAIDEVIELFPESTPPLPGVGRYVGMSVPEAVRDFLVRNVGSFFTASEITAELQREGLVSESPNFSTIVNTACSRLAEKDNFAVREKGGRKAFGIPTTSSP